jgi:hypothetical protein
MVLAKDMHYFNEKLFNRNIIVSPKVKTLKKLNF